MCEMRLLDIQNLPLQDAVWTIKIVEDENTLPNHSSTGRIRKLVIEEELGSCRNILQTGTVDSDVVQFGDQMIDLLLQACIAPRVKHSRKPRFLLIKHELKMGNIQCDLTSSGIRVFNSAEKTAMSELRKAKNSFEDAPWFRSCHSCGRRGTPDMFSSCFSCQGVIFCDEQCRSESDHIAWCPYFMEYMKYESALGHFPFPFSQTSTGRDFNVFKLRKFLRENGVHGLGLWKRECKLSLSSYYNIPFGEMQAGDCVYGSAEDTDLLRRGFSCMNSQFPRGWAEYYQLRGLEMSSPVAALLHYSLTLAYIVNHLLPEQNPEVSESIKESQTVCIHVVGAAKEADLRSTFKECALLLHPVSLHICFIGPEISDRMHLHTEVTDNLQCTLISGLYHEVYPILPYGDVAISFNAGLGAYSDYRLTVQQILSIGMPYICTDYCLASYKHSQDSVRMMEIATLSAPQVNPFRSPLRMVYTDMDIPRYSNAVIFTVHPFDKQSQQLEFTPTKKEQFL